MKALVKTCLIFNLINMILWAIMTPISMMTPLKDSVPYLVGVSVWALFSSSFATTISCLIAIKELKRDESSE